MITSVPQSNIPAILIHQLESFLPISDEKKECVNEKFWGHFLE